MRAYLAHQTGAVGSRVRTPRSGPRQSSVNDPNPTQSLRCGLPERSLCPRHSTSAGFRSRVPGRSGRAAFLHPKALRGVPLSKARRLLTRNVETQNGGAERVRTADLCVANAALSQLSYGPTYLVIGSCCCVDFAGNRGRLLTGWPVEPRCHRLVFSRGCATSFEEARR